MTPEIRKAIKKMIKAVDAVSDSENSEGCTEDLTVINMEAFTNLIASKHELLGLLNKEI